MSPEELKTGLTQNMRGVVFPDGDALKKHNIYFDIHYSPDMDYYDLVQALIAHLQDGYIAMCQYDFDNNIKQLQALKPAPPTRALTAADIDLLRQMKIGV